MSEQVMNSSELGWSAGRVRYSCDSRGRGLVTVLMIRQCRGHGPLHFRYPFLAFLVPS